MNMNMNKDLIVIMIILLLVVLAHLITVDYENAIEVDSVESKEADKVEPLVISDSDYSECKVGCLIACTNKHGILQKECYPPCVDQCWNY